MRDFVKGVDDACIRYDAKLTLCKNGYFKGKEYEKRMEKKREGFELVGDSPGTPRKPKKEKTEQVIEKRNLIRTRDNLIAYASENESIWSSFVTLTFKENMTDITKANRAFNNFCKMWHRVKPDFAYLCVPEFQKRGAIHYHLLSNLKCGEDIPARDLKKTYNPEHKKWYQMTYYDIPYWNHGFSTAEDMSTYDDKFNCALYVTKYLYKDVDNRLWGRKKILKSNNLKAPTTYYLQSETFQGVLAYLMEKGYPLSTYQVLPADKYQIPSIIWSSSKRLCTGDLDRVTSIVYNTVTNVNSEKYISSIYGGDKNDKVYSERHG